VQLLRRGLNNGSRTQRGLVGPAQPSAEPFRSLRLALELRTEARRGNIVVFTSAHPGEGKSTIASNYALVASLTQQRVLLVDADLRHPALHELFNVPRAPGLVDALGDLATQAEHRHRVRTLGHLELLTAGREVPGIGDLMSSRRMAEVLDAASAEYDTVVVDTPPVLAVSDAAGIAARPDADVVLVVEQKTRRRAVVRALRELDVVGVGVLGLVVNRAGELSLYGYA
jgi:capsular exopolysaccharide synthesis family protein